MDIISIHIPKTAGTSFYSILQQVYGDELSICFRRRDYMAVKDQPGGLAAALGGNVKVLHGHFKYSEIASLHRTHQAQLICWMRDPIQRVVSNYRFFKSLFDHPERNPANYELNKHRISETLLTYAEREETRNRMHHFLEGIPLSDFLFIGMQETFHADIERLGQLLDWPAVQIPFLNKTPHAPAPLDVGVEQQLIQWNLADIALYIEACRLRNLPVPLVYQKL